MSRLITIITLLLTLSIVVRETHAQDSSQQVTDETVPAQTLTEKQLAALRQGAAEPPF